MATITVPMPDELSDWVERQASSDRYESAGQYLCDLIQRDRDRQRAVAELQQLVDEGLASGPAQPFDLETFLALKRQAHAAQSHPAERIADIHIPPLTNRPSPTPPPSGRRCSLPRRLSA